MKNITIEWLEKNNACNEGKKWFTNRLLKSHSVKDVINGLVQDSKFNWANWTITKLFTKQQSVLFVCYTARLSLKYFESKYPKDKRPRKAIEAAEEWSKNPTKKNKLAARSAAEAAWSAAESEELAAEAAWSAAESAWLAARSAELAARSAESAWSAARTAAWSAARSAELAARTAAWSAAESAAVWKDILLFGLKLLRKRKSI